MKTKGLVGLLIIILPFLAASLPLTALAGVVTPTLPDLPGTFNPLDYVDTFLGYIGTIIALTALINRLLNWSDWNKRLLSWGVIAFTGLLSYFMKWGIFDTAFINVVFIMLGAVAGAHLGYHAVKLILIDFGVLPEPKE